MIIRTHRCADRLGALALALAFVTVSVLCLCLAGCSSEKRVLGLIEDLAVVDATHKDERAAEERRVHAKTHEILNDLPISGMPAVLSYYSRWHTPFEGLQDR